jgi:hypothetical protein
MAKKLATSNLSFQGFEGFIRTQNENNFSNPCEGFFLENPLFVLWLTLIMDLVDAGTFIYDSFIMLQKNAFSKIFFEFYARGQKCHIGNFSLLAKWHF